MFQKSSTIILFFFLFFQLSFSQEVAIPFRDGDKWGFSNEEAKMLIEPKFDSYQFGKSYSTYHDFIITKKNNLEGLVINGKEILKPLFNEIFENNNRFTATSDEKGKTVSIFLPNGTAIFDKPVASILDSGHFVGNTYMYHVLHHDATESVFVFDENTQKIGQYLYKNAFSIFRVRRQFDAKQFGFLVQKSKKSKLIEESWDASTFPYKQNNTGLRYMKESEFLNYFLDKYYKSNSRNSYETDAVYDVDYDVVEVPPVSSGYSGNTRADVIEGDTRQSNKQFNYSFKQENNQYLLVISTFGSPKPLSSTSVKFPEKASDISIKREIIRSVNEDYSTNTFYNYLTYKNGDKTGLIFANDLQNPIEFDYIDSKTFNVRSANSWKNDIVFIVGKKDNKGQLKYGVYSITNKQILDFVYDELEPITLYNNQGNQIFIAKKDLKYGIVESDGTILVKVNKPEIVKLKSENSISLLLSFEENNKYGVVYSNNNKIEKTEAIFDYPVKDMILNYPKINNRRLLDSEKVTQKINLVELMNKDGIFIGYANTNGTLYYKN